MHIWLGKGLTLEEFLQLPAGDQRARLWEMSDVDQLLFVERHLDWFAALLGGFPPESILPEMEPYGAIRPGVIVATVERFPEAELTKQQDAAWSHLLRGANESPDDTKAVIINFPTSSETTGDKPAEHPPSV